MVKPMNEYPNDCERAGVAADLYEAAERAKAAHDVRAMHASAVERSVFYGLLSPADGAELEASVRQGR